MQKIKEMKIAIYTICKNEEHFVDRFMENLNEADGVFVTDTGSSDGTVEKLRSRGVHVNQIKLDPWRFDLARNASLQFIPADYDVCFSIDLDEVISAGWRKAIESVWHAGVDRVRYPYVWNTLPDGREGVTFWYDKIHRRHGFRWVKPVHEVLQLEHGTKHEVQVYTDQMKLRHFPDPTKSRGSYLGLLELACREEPHDDRSAHYLGREYMFWRRFDEAIRELQRHLSLPSATWDAERSASMRFISKCYQEKGDLVKAQSWALRACAEAPGEREPWVELGRIFYKQNNLKGTYFAMTQALSITEKPLSYMCEPESWGGYPHDLAGVAAWHLGMKEASLAHHEKAAELEPGDERIQKNLQIVKSLLQ